MKSLANGLSVLFLTVMTFIGTDLGASFSGWRFNVSRPLPNFDTELGNNPTYRPVPTSVVVSWTDSVTN